MDTYTLSRNWFDFGYENPDLIRPVHTAIYFFAIDHCNRLGNKDKFGFPTTMVMEAIGIKSYNTYIEAFNDIVKWGFIKLIEKSKNQYSSNIITVATSKNNKANNKALDKALIKHGIKHCCSIDESTIQSIDSINKQSNNQTIKQTNNQILIFDEFRKIYPGTKRGNDTEFGDYCKKHKDWQECLHLLKPAIENQIQAKKAKEQKGKFVPEWKNLKTWINQRCWEEDVSSNEKNNIPEYLIGFTE